ncbi:MAG TPA: PaaI family thioesterase [Bryobacterales bacterium]|nr:PaaI family thioesterase [Bryobacterales bacterium]
MTLRELNALVRTMPFNHSLGIRVVRRHRDGLTIECRVRDDLRNGAGVLHGGVTATLADVAVGIALNDRFEGRRKITTVELKVNYLLPIEAGRVAARARLIRVGSTVAVGRVDIFDDRKRLAGAALVTYMLLPQG